MNKPIGYTIMFDEEKDKAMTVLLNLAGMFLETEKGNHLMEEHITEQEKKCITSLVEEKSDKSHELGWCHDSKCIHKKGVSPSES